MGTLLDALYHRDGDLYLSTPLTRGPWDDRFQHGGPPSALVAGAIARFGDASGFQLARLTVELIRPVPIAPLRLQLRPVRLGRQAQRIAAELLAGDEVVVQALGLRIRRERVAIPPRPSDPPWPDPQSLPPFTFHFFQNEVAFHKAVELRAVHGTWGRTPVGYWARPVVELVAGRPWSPEERLAALADAQSGMGPPLDPAKWSYLNPDLTVYLERMAVGEWLGFDIRSVASEEGMGLSQSEVRDQQGICARTAQSLVIARRSAP